MATINATYKRRNGDAWDDIYFKTSAGQVGVSSSRKFVTTSTKVNNVSFTLDSSGDGASVTLYAGDIKISSSDNTTIASKLEALQTLDADLTAIAGLSGTSGFLKKTAANTWALDTTVLTSGNYSTTLGSVYQAKFTDGSGTIASESSSIVTIYPTLSQSGGAVSVGGTGIALAKVAKTGAFGDLSGTGNVVTSTQALTNGYLIEGVGNKAAAITTKKTADVVTASSNFTTDKILVAAGNNKTVTASTYSVYDLKNLAEGASEAWVTDLYDSGTKLLFGKSAGSASESIDTLTNTTTVTITSSTEEVTVPTGYTYLYCLDGDGIALRAEDGKFSIKIADLQIGDVLYITNTDVPDFWWDGGKFCKLETTKVDLDDYALASSLDSYVLKTNGVTGVSYDSSSHKIQKTINGSTTDVVDLDNFASIANNTVTIGSNTFTHQAMKYRAIKVAGTQQIADTSNTALNFLNGGNVTFTWDSTNTGVKASVDLSSYATKASPTFTGTITMPFSSAGFVKTNASGVLSVDTTTYLSSIPSDYHKIYYSAASSAPSSPSTGDFWIATS